MKKAGKITVGIVIGLAAVAALSAAVMWLWNWICPETMGWSTISFWQALGLFALCKILFAHPGMRHHRHGRHNFHKNRFKEKWDEMTPEQRKEFVKKHRAGRFHHPFCDSETSPENGNNEQHDQQ